MKTINHLEPASLEVTAETIRSYADLTGDYNPLHLDPVFAASTPMGRVIAHGTMSICLLFSSIERSFPGIRLDAMELDVKFTSPVYEGDHITAGGRRKDGGGNQFEVWVRAEDDNVRLSGLLTLPTA